MTDRDALMAALLESPHDDTPRSVLADYLDDHGEGERSAFIRVQCELARMPATQIIEDQICQRCKRRCGDRPSAKYCEHGSDPDGKNSHAWRNPLRRRERELLKANYVDWVPSYFDHEQLVLEKVGASCVSFSTMPPASVQYTFSRGFISAIRLDWYSWLTHHDAIFWNPRQTVRCPRNCHGGESGYVEFVGGADRIRSVPCIERCDHGRLPRPMTRKVRNHKERIYVLADNHAQANHYAARSGRLPFEWRYITSEHEVLGLSRDAALYWVGSQKHDSLARLLINRGLNVLSVDVLPEIGYTEQHISATCQPLERIAVSEIHPSHIIERSSDRVTLAGHNGTQHRFTRMKCRTCDGTGTSDEIVNSIYGHPPEYGPCPNCHGTPPNEWECDAWPGVVFELPEATTHHRIAPTRRSRGAT